MQKETRNVNILGIPYEIREVDVVDKYSPANGMIEYEKCLITIDKNLPLELKNRTLLHEIVHGIFYMIGYCEDAENEQKVQGIANALHLLMSSDEPIFFS